MKLEKAIKLLTYYQTETRWWMNPKEIDALKLGIEALKAVEHSRGMNHEVPIRTLPGETED